VARRLAAPQPGAAETQLPAAELRPGDHVIVSAGELVPADGEIVQGLATINEAAVTGESAPVLREAGTDRSGVIGGTKVLSDQIIVRVTAEPGHSFLDRMIALVEGANRQKTPNEIALTLLLAAMTLTFLVVVATLPAIGAAVGVQVDPLLLIALLGLCWAGIVTNSPAPGAPLKAGSFATPGVWVALFGTLVIAGLMAWRVWGAILWGVVAAALLAWPLGLLTYEAVPFQPPDIGPILFKLDIPGALGLFMVIFVFFFMDLFDTVGTLIGVGEQGGFMKEGKLPRARQALLSDAIGTVAGACMGTSTVTSYIESAAGIGQGGRTGLANVTTAVLFLLALFTAPVVSMIAGAQPVIAPALIVVGAMMLKGVAKVKWDDVTEAIPAYISLVVIPLTMSIALGIALGFLCYTVLKVVTGKYKEVHWILYLVDVLVVAYLVKGVG